MNDNVKDTARSIMNDLDAADNAPNRGLFVGHISPEAYEGGALALARSGDTISIDIEARTITLNVDESELEKRRAEWVRPEKQLPDGYLNTYRKNSLSAARGAVVE